MYKILKNIIEMDDYSVQKLSNLQPPEPFEWNTVEGTELNVSDCIGGKGKIEVKGNTEQKQLSGKNLFDKDNPIEKRGSINNNNIFRGGGGNYCIVIPCKPNTTYTAQKRNDGDTNRLALASCETNPSDTADVDTPLLNNVRNDSAGNLSITTGSTANYIIMQYYRNVESTLTKQQILDSIQIEEGSTATDYEPYCGGQPSPNPDYPQEIKVVTGNNLIKHVGKNLFVGYDNMLNGFLPTANSYPTVNSSYPNARYQILELKAGESITTTIDANYSEGRIRAIDAKTNKIISSIEVVENDYYSTTETYAGSFRAGTITAKKDLLIGVMLLKRPTIDLSFQIEYGNNPTPYEPYREEEYKLDLWKENEFDSENANVLNAYFSEDGKMITSSNKSKTLYIPCKANCTYKITKKLSKRFRLLTTNVLPDIGVIGDNFIFGDLVNCLKITTGSNAKYLCVFFYNSDYDTLTVQEILDSIQIQEAIELCKIGDYEDILFKNVVGDENYNAELESGAWYKKKAIDKKILDDSWTWFMPTTNRFHVNIPLPNGEYDLVALCDKFINALYWPVHINTDKSFIVHNGNWGNNMCRISFLDSDYDSLDEWTQFVSENNLIVYHRLLNPTYEKITDTTLISQLEALRKAKWFKGVNHWWTETNNLEPNLKGTYRQAINE